jgi:phosphate/sulfate permease
MHAAAEQFDSRAEGLYSYAQIFTACCVSFAHGANDVANSIGPFAAIYQVTLGCPALSLMGGHLHLACVACLGASTRLTPSTIRIGPLVVLAVANMYGMTAAGSAGRPNASVMRVDSRQ